MEKKKKWMIFGGTAVVVVGVFLCIAAFFLYKGVTLFFDREIVADQYLEQMTSAASQGDRDAMRSLYMPGAVPEEHMERQIQENVDIWGKSQLDSFKKKGLNIRTSTKNGVETKSVECSYGIKTEDGQRFTAILNRMESSDGNQGIISFIIRDNVSLAPQGTLRSISHWNVFQWGLFLLSLIMIFSTIATAVICYRQNPRYKWGWIILILIAYLSMGFSVIRTPNTWEFKVNWSAATVRLSQYVTYENGSREAGKLPQRSMETGNLARRSVVTGNLFIGSMKTRKPALRIVQTRKPVLRIVQTGKTTRRSVQTGKPARNSVRIQTENPGVYLNCLKKNLTSQNRFLGEFGERF